MPKSIRVILKDSNSYETYYRVSQNSSGAIIGESGNKYLHHYHLIIHPNTMVDYHFTYPENGDCHFSFKVHPTGEDKSERTGREVRIYKDRITDKYFYKGDVFVNTYPRDYEDDSIIRLVKNQISKSASPPIKDIERYNFPSFNIRVKDFTETIAKKPKPLSKLRQTINDIIIDVPSCNYDLISLQCFIHHDDQPDSLSSQPNTVCKQLKVASGVNLKVYCWLLNGV